MSAKADWIVVAGFLLVVLGGSLRIFIMMRSADTRPVNALRDSRILMRAYSIPQQQAAVSDAHLALRRSSAVDRGSVARISLTGLKALSWKHRPLLLATVSASACPVASLVQ